MGRCIAWCIVILSSGFSLGRADEPWSLRLAALPDGQHCVEARGWSPRQLIAMSQVAVPDSLSRRLQVRVFFDQDALLPAMVGEYSIVGGAVRFTPRYPLQPGVAYRASLWADPPDTAPRMELPFSLELPPQPATRVAAIYPSSHLLPENQLKFYFHFTAPPRRGEAYDRIRLYSENGDLVEDPFLELGEELWDPDGRRFTLLIDPGRIKRGLKPREEVGPVLETGKSYRLVVDGRWKDAFGRPLAQSSVKEFRVGAADETQPDPQLWRLNLPAAGSRQPLVVEFGEALDHALAQRMLGIVDAQGNPVAGESTVDQHEQRWLLTPDRPWAAGAYALQVDVDLEDLAGNSIRKPFEVDVSGPVRKQLVRELYQRNFEIR